MSNMIAKSLKTLYVSIMLNTIKKISPSDRGTGLVSPTGLRATLNEAADAISKNKEPHKLSVRFSVAEERVLANKLAGKNPHPLTFTEKQHLVKALGDISADRDIYKELAFTDELTGVFSRKGLADAMQREFAKLGEDRRDLYQDAEVAILYMDLDHFKNFNDSLGHQKADEMLKQFADRMKETFRATDILGRAGGDEFVMVMPYSANDEPAPTAQMLRERMDEALKNLVLWDGDTPYPLSVSIGLSTSQDDLSHIEADNLMDAMVECADQRMYADKEGRRERLQILQQAAIEDASKRIVPFEASVE